MSKKIISIIFSLFVLVLLFSFFGCTDKRTDDKTTTQPTENVSKQEITEAKVVPEETHTVEVSEVNEVTEKTTTVEAESTAAEMTTEEIVDLFNSSANRIKTEAVKVVKNYEKRNLDEDELDMPKVLEAVAETMIPVFMKDDTEPIVYDTSEEISSEYQVPNQPYVSKMKVSDVAQASCEDNGKEYFITIRLKREDSPLPGSGVGAVFDVIEANEVAEKASFIEKFTTEYYNCTVKVRINKETGRVVWSNYTTPLVLNITVNMFGTHNVSAGLTFEKDYTVTY